MNLSTIDTIKAVKDTAKKAGMKEKDLFRVQYKIIGNFLYLDTVYGKIEKDLLKYSDLQGSFKYPCTKIDDIEAIELKERVYITGLTYDILKEILLYCSDDETRYFMNGVFFDTENHCIVATDGRTMQKRNILFDENSNKVKGFIIDKKYLNFMLKGMNKDSLLTVSAIDNKNLVLYVNNQFKGDFSLACKAIEGQFPNYERVIPHGYTQKEILRIDELQELISKGNEKDLLENSNEFKKTKKIELTFGSEKYGFNYEYLERLFFGKIDSVYINFESTTRAIFTEKRNALSIIMPMQLD